MSAPEIEAGYPLHWPNERPRTVERKSALFRSDGRPLTWTGARRRLLDQVEAMTPQGRTYRVTDMVLSTNIRFTASGSRDRNVSRRDPDDVGAAFYCSLDGKPHVLACDRWDTVQDNVAAIAAHIEALRGQERWGVADMRQAFAGHVRLPAPDPWWQVLRVESDAGLSTITRAYRERAKITHPDSGGDRAEWDRVSAAYAAAKAARR